MKRAVQIVSALALVAVIAAIVGQALTVSQGIYYGPDGQPLSHTPVTQVVTILDIAGILAMPLTVVAFILGVIATALERRYGWLVALLVAGALTFAGLFGMAWIILSERSPIAFQTPFALIPLVTLVYSMLPARRNAAAGVV